MLPLPTETKTTTRHTVAVYLLLGIGLIVGVVAGIAWLFTGK